MIGMNQINLLLVEDNEGDMVLLREAFEENNLIKSFKAVRDGEAALNYLEESSKVDILPNLVLLDINLPRINGLEVLKWIKSNQLIKKIPVIILTTSSSKKDIEAAYENYANAYLTKPSDANLFQEMVTDIERFWVKTAKVPF
jgi:CheY-like chemotaxis protein